MLNRPARNASPTARPVRISGVALVSVSEIGLRIATPLLEYSEFGLKIYPSNSCE
jgi:hypothetical protein